MSSYGYTKTCWLYACFSLFMITHYNEHFTSLQCTGSACFGCRLTPLTWLIICHLSDQLREKTAQNRFTQRSSLYDNIHCQHTLCYNPYMIYSECTNLYGFQIQQSLAICRGGHASAEILSQVQP